MVRYRVFQEQFLNADSRLWAPTGLWLGLSLTLLFVSLVLSSGGSARAATIPEELDGLRIEIGLPKTDFVVGEPIIVALRLANISEHDLAVTSWLNDRPQGAPVRFVFFDPEGVSATWKPGIRKVLVPCRVPRWLSPGEYVEARYNLAASSQPIGMPLGSVHWTCSKPGIYQIVGRYRVPPGWRGEFWKGEIQSERISFNVSEPELVDKEALNLQTELMLHYLNGGSMDSNRTASVLRQIMVEFGQSSYGIYAEFYLGEVLWGENAASHLQRFVAEHPDFVLTPDAEFLIADKLYSAGKVSEAREQLRRASAAYPYDAHTSDGWAVLMSDPANDAEIKATVETRQKSLERVDQSLEER